MAYAKHRLARETGIALAVLAMYVLTLLLPVHTGAALQRDLNTLGYSNLSSWSVCASLAKDTGQTPVDPSSLTCPTNGIAKSQLTAVLPPAVSFVSPVLQALGRVPLPSVHASTTRPPHFGQSRAPPAAV